MSHCGSGPIVRLSPWATKAWAGSRPDPDPLVRSALRDSQQFLQLVFPPCRSIRLCNGDLRPVPEVEQARLARNRRVCSAMLTAPSGHACRGRTSNLVHAASEKPMTLACQSAESHAHNGMRFPGHKHRMSDVAIRNGPRFVCVLASCFRSKTEHYALLTQIFHLVYLVVMNALERGNRRFLTAPHHARFAWTVYNLLSYSAHSISRWPWRVRKGQSAAMGYRLRMRLSHTLR